MYVPKVPGIFWRLFPGLLWKMPETDRSLFLTFDDGPIPGVTDFALEQLEKFGAKATFFCLGKNVEAHPALYQRIIKSGHAIGNHTYHHLNGWETDDEIYYDDIDRCAQKVNSRYFRPPYGKITMAQINYLKPHYKIVMWDVMSGDFDPEISKEKCLKNVINNASDGSIIVMHDSAKAEPKLRFALPKILEHFSEKGYLFLAID